MAEHPDAPEGRAAADPANAPEGRAVAEHPNAARIRAAIAAFSEGDLSHAAALIDPHCHYRVNGRSVIAGTYVGREQVLGFFRRLRELTDGTFTATPFLVFADDDHAVAVVDITATRGEDHIAYAAIIVAELSEGRIVEMWSITDDPYRVDPFWGSRTV